MPPRLSMRANALKQLLPNSRTQLARPSIILLTTSSPLPPPSLRLFTSTPHPFKKISAAEREARENEVKETADPYDFSPLESGIEKVLDRLKNDLSKLKTGGRFNPEVLENLRVQLVKDAKKTERLGDLAQVLPKGGRNLMILVGEKDHVKPVISAIQGSKDLNLQPVVDAKNVSQLNVPIPPPTKESRDLALAAASKAGEKANNGVRDARAVMHKKLREMELKRLARPDDLIDAKKKMEKVVETGVADVKKTVDAARKAMEQV